jgi:hypothetical protein
MGQHQRTVNRKAILLASGESTVSTGASQSRREVALGVLTLPVCQNEEIAANPLALRSVIFLATWTRERAGILNVAAR